MLVWGEPFSSPSTDSKNYLRLQSSARREGQQARLISPMLVLPRSAVCLVFRYHVFGGRGTMLQVWREAVHEKNPLWIIREDQEDEWREGRILLPSYEMAYQVRSLRRFLFEILSGFQLFAFQILPQNLFHSSLKNIVELGFFFSSSSSLCFSCCYSN